MYKAARDTTAPAARPGAQSIPGMQERDITFTPDVEQAESTPLPPSHPSEDQPLEQPVMRQTLSAQQDRSDPKILEAELARTDSDIEERILERLKQSAPVAEAKPMDDVVKPAAGAAVVQEKAPEPPKNRKKMWIIAIVGVLVLAGVGAGLGIALSGGDDDDSPTERPTEPPKPIIQADYCETSEEWGVICANENTPVDGLLTGFFPCPSTAGENVLECEWCSIAQAEGIVDLVENEDLVFCNRCVVCNDRVSFDCSNLAPDNDCAIVDCDGNCKNAEEPVNPDEHNEADACFEFDAGSIECYQERTPEDFLLTLFSDCPDDSGDDVFACGDCHVFLEDIIVEFDNIWPDSNALDPQCNECVVCTNSISYDCSNLAAPGDPCAVKNCAGECIG